MPDETDTRDGTDGKVPHSSENSPDLVGEELGDGARIWRVYDRVARDEDRERIGNWNRGLDNLALFAGLFSAVTTAFIIQLQQDTEPDYARLTFLVLNASAAGVAFEEEPFIIDPSVRLTNCLWIASLILSLTAALIAIMGKDWIGMYASRPVCNPRQWAEIRTYRLACVERWYMSGVIASAPVLLHISLVLFSAGLVVFVSPDPFSQRVALGLALAAGGLYCVTVLSAIVFPMSPFKSPATQAIRGTLASVFTYIYDLVAYPPRRNPILFLNLVTLVTGSVFSRPLPADILPLEQTQRRRLRRGDVRVLWNYLFPPQPSGQTHTWRNMTARVFAEIVRARSTALALGIFACIRSARDEYHYRLQHPRTRPWHSSVWSYICRTVLSDRWAEVRDKPTVDLLARSMSDLSMMTHSTDVFLSIIAALGDLAIGRTVAPILSFDLQARLTTHIRHNWRKADPTTLSRFILTDQHLSDKPLIPLSVINMFSGPATIRSEIIVFALVELQKSVIIPIETLINHLPDNMIQPRALRHLLPRARDIGVFIVLTGRYWDPFADDEPINVDDEVRKRLRPWMLNQEEELRRWEVVELLVYLLCCISRTVTTMGCLLILKLLAAESRHSLHVRERPFLLYAFGHMSPQEANAAWAAVSERSHVNLLELALPLDQFLSRRLRKRTSPSVSHDDSILEMCLARTIARLLFPVRNIYNSVRGGLFGSIVSTLELCVRCLHAQLCHPGRGLEDCDILEMITLLLENSVLIRVCDLWRIGIFDRTRAAERDVVNILTAIGRRITALLSSRLSESYHTGARLFCLFAFSEATDPDGQPVTWDLGLYLREIADRLSEQQGQGTEVSVCRLHCVVRTLRPLCAPRNDLRAAWERINLPSDPEYHESFWDAEDFELVPLLEPYAHVASSSEALPGTVSAILTVGEEFTALHYLDVAMR